MNEKKINPEALTVMDQTLVVDHDSLSHDINPDELRKQLGLKQYSDIDYYGETTLLGRGGGGMVLEGFDYNLGRKVAIKILQQKKCNTPESLERFVREARATAQLEHPNIVPIHQIGVDPTWGLFFTMKKLDGENLKDIIFNLQNKDKEYIKKYTLTNLLNIFTDVCNGVAYAHSKGIMHRDLKPENIFVGDFGEVLVLDWGLVRDFHHQIKNNNTENELDIKNEQNSSNNNKNQVHIALNDSHDPFITLDGLISGTPYYMSPEQVTGDNEKIDDRSDIYTLGVILYQILTLELPFKETNVEDLMHSVFEGQFLPPHKASPKRKISRELNAITLKAMSHKPEDRYQSVEDFQKDLQNYSEDFPIAAVQYSIFSRFWKLCLRNKVLSVSMSAVLLTSIIGFSLHQATSYIKYNALYESATVHMDSSVSGFRNADKLKVLSSQKHRESSKESEDATDCEEMEADCKEMEEKAQNDSKLAIAMLDAIPEKFKKSKKVKQAYIKLFKDQIAHCVKKKDSIQAEDWLKQLEECLDMDNTIPNAEKKRQIEELRKLINSIK